LNPQIISIIIKWGGGGGGGGWLLTWQNICSYTHEHMLVTLSSSSKLGIATPNK